MNESNGVLRDARKLGIPKMLILGLQRDCEKKSVNKILL